MAYWFALYLPTNSGITSASVYTESGTLLASGIEPLGTVQQAWSKSGVTTGLSITPVLQSGVSVSQWVINVDGDKYYQYTHTCSIGYIASASQINVRLEVTGTPTTVGSLTLSFKANGGSGGPGSAGPFTVTNNVAVVTLPDYTTNPTRTGYTFQGWSFSDTATSADYYPGVKYNNWWAADGNTTQILYAVWTKNGSTGKVQIGNGYGFDSYTPYIWYNGGWHKAVPYVWYNGGWKKGV